MTVRVRFAPSPTGDPHIGNVRTVVFNWLFARKNGGKFILRIEDTDRTRYAPESLPVIMDGLRWLGLDWDEGPDAAALRKSGVENADKYGVGGDYGPYVQSERLSRYREVAEELIDLGWAYRCNCSPQRLERVRREQLEKKLPVMYDRHCRNLPEGTVSPDEPHVIRLKVPLEGETVVQDVIKGDVVFDNSGIDDQILMKSDGFPTYHLAVVVDDHHMEITHIARGDDWIPSTPKRVLLYQALGWEIPVYCHVPLVRGPDGKKLSKRHGATSITEFRDQGYLPQALFNFLALLGWAPGEGDEQEIFSRQELVERFDLFRVNSAPASFSYDKLDWMNGVYIRDLPPEDLVEHLIPFWQKADLIPDPVPEGLRPQLEKIVPLVQERLKRLTDVVEWTDFFFTDVEPPDRETLVPKGLDAEGTRVMLEQVRGVLVDVAPFDAEQVEEALRGFTGETDYSNRQVLATLRWVVTAKKASPPLFGTIAALGKEATLERIEASEQVLQGV